MRALALAILFVAAPAQAQIACTIVDMTMTSPNGVVIQGINQSSFFGGRSFAPGTGDRKTPDGRDIYDLGNKGIFLGGATEAVRITPAPPAAGKPQGG